MYLIIIHILFIIIQGYNGYKYLQLTGYPSPTVRILCWKLEQYRVDVGILYDVEELLKFKVQNLHISDRSCYMSIDEMQIWESKDYNKTTRTFCGFVLLKNWKTVF